MKGALVTGAGHRLGRAMALELAAQGFDVAVHYASSADGADETVRLIEAAGGRAVALQADLLDEEQTQSLFPRAVEALGGPITCLVNNASIFTALQPKPFFQIDNDEFDKVKTVNSRGVHQATKAVLPAMLRAGGGKIVNIASGTFYYGPPGLSHYTASKGAVIALTRCHGRELGDKNIQVNAIAPGLTESEGMQGHTGFDPARAPTVASRSIKRDMLPEDLLGSLMYLITPDSDFVTGQTLNVDGGKINL